MNIANSLAEARRVADQRRVREALGAAMAIVKSVIDATEPASNSPLPIVERGGELCYHVNATQVLAAALPGLSDNTIWQAHNCFVFHSITDLTGLGVRWDGVGNDIYIAELPYGREFELIPAPAVQAAAPAAATAAGNSTMGIRRVSAAIPAAAPAAGSSTMGIRRAKAVPTVQVHYIDVIHAQLAARAQAAARGDEAMPAAAACPAPATACPPPSAACCAASPPASPPMQRRMPPVCPGAPKRVKHESRLQ